MAKDNQKTEKNARDLKNLQSLDALTKLINRHLGDGAVLLGQHAIVKVDIISTGVATIDCALGCMGLPRGRIIELFGQESSGKTTLALQCIASCQNQYFEKQGRQGTAAFIDVEHALDPDWATKVGVNMDNLLLSQPDSGEEGIQIVEWMIKSRLVDLIVVDSVAALTPKAVLDGEMTDSHIAALPRLMSAAMTKLKGECSKSQTIIIFINQLRERVGVLFGNPEQTPGGRALKFYASVRIEIKKGTAIKDGDRIVGFRPTAKIIKNKVAPPFKSAGFEICFDDERKCYGIDSAKALLEALIDNKIINNINSFFYYGDKKLGHGLPKALATLNENQELVAELKNKLYVSPAVPVVGDVDGEFTGIIDELSDNDG